jgi:hypothetical protein
MRVTHPTGTRTSQPTTFSHSDNAAAIAETSIPMKIDV